MLLLFWRDAGAVEPPLETLLARGGGRPWRVIRSESEPAKEARKPFAYEIREAEEEAKRLAAQQAKAEAAERRAMRALARELEKQNTDLDRAIAEIEESRRAAEMRARALEFRAQAERIRLELGAVQAEIVRMRRLADDEEVLTVLLLS